MLNVVLLNCGDIEANPGPGRARDNKTLEQRDRERINNGRTSSTRFRSTLSSSFSLSQPVETRRQS